MIKSNILMGLPTMIILIIITMVTTGSSYEISKVYAENNYCYDQVGDGRHCFEKQSNCHKTQKHDEIAESPCYKDGLGL